MHGLGLSTRIRTLLAVIFVIAVLVAYGSSGEMAMLHEIARIPFIEYAVVGLLYVVFLIAVRVSGQKHP